MQGVEKHAIQSLEIEKAELAMVGTASGKPGGAELDNMQNGDNTEEESDSTKSAERLLRAHQAECRNLLAARQAAFDSKIDGIEQALASHVDAALEQAVVLEKHARNAQIECRSITFGGTETVEIERNEEENDTDTEEEEEEDEELLELYNDPDYQEFLREGGVHELCSEDLEGYT